MRSFPMRPIAWGRRCRIAAGLMIACGGWTGGAAADGDVAAREPRTGVFPFFAYAARHDMWEFTPMDQGGRLVQLQVIGSERDEEIARVVRAPGFFAPWGDPIRWDSLEGSELEKSVWLNRWYFLPSLARMYHVSGDKTYLREILAFVRKWRDDNPRPADIGRYIATQRRNWRDMQVAWRVQNLAWCYFLGGDGWTAQEKRELQDLVEVHAGVLLEDFGTRPLNENNHQSHGATTMLFAAVLFPEIQNADALTAKAIQLLEHHLANAFYADGNSVELCPGYYPFFVSIFRDAYLLCRANGITPPRGSEHRLRQFYQYLLKVVQPDGTMPPINDSSESNARVVTQVLADMFDEAPPPRPAASHWFDASHQAVMRDHSAGSPGYVFLDAGPQVTSHWHAGKLGFHLWYWDRPLLIDSGISNYDDPLKRSWYLLAPAHNTILVDGKGDYDRTPAKRISDRPWAGSRIAQWESNDRYDWAVMVHDGLAEGVAWTRHFVLLKGTGSVIVDQLESAAEHQYTWLFHLPPGSPAVDAARGTVFTAFDEKNLLLHAAGAGTPALEMREGNINRRSKNHLAPIAAYGARATSVAQSYLLLPVRDGAQPKTQIVQTVAGKTISVRVSTPSGDTRLEILKETMNGKDEYRLRVDGGERGEP